jgi:hypothetical protein
MWMPLFFTYVASSRHAALYLAAKERGGHVALHVLGRVLPPCMYRMPR